MVYIDIHTHFDRQEKDIVYIRNLIAGKDPCIIKEDRYYSCGIHPWYLGNEKWDILSKHLKHPLILAIGECGLDYRKEYLEKLSKKEQLEYFIKQIEIAEALHKPLIIHCVKCIHELIHLRKKYPDNPWIYHGFNKNVETARQLLQSNIYLSFGSSIIHSTTTAEALSKTPLNRLFLETDDQNELSIKELYKRAAQILNIEESQLIESISDNFQKVFTRIMH